MSKLRPLLLSLLLCLCLVVTANAEPLTGVFGEPFTIGKTVTAEIIDPEFFPDDKLVFCAAWDARGLLCGVREGALRVDGSSRFYDFDFTGRATPRKYKLFFLAREDFVPAGDPEEVIPTSVPGQEPVPWTEVDPSSEIFRILQTASRLSICETDAYGYTPIIWSTSVNGQYRSFQALMDQEGQLVTPALQSCCMVNDRYYILCKPGADNAPAYGLLDAATGELLRDYDCTQISSYSPFLLNGTKINPLMLTDQEGCTLLLPEAGLSCSGLPLQCGLGSDSVFSHNGVCYVIIHTTSSQFIVVPDQMTDPRPEEMKGPCRIITPLGDGLVSLSDNDGIKNVWSLDTGRLLLQADLVRRSGNLLVGLNSRDDKDFACTLRTLNGTELFTCQEGGELCGLLPDGWLLFYTYSEQTGESIYRVFTPAGADVTPASGEVIQVVPVGDTVCMVVMGQDGAYSLVDHRGNVLFSPTKSIKLTVTSYPTTQLLALVQRTTLDISGELHICRLENNALTTLVSYDELDCGVDPLCVFSSAFYVPSTKELRRLDDGALIASAVSDAIEWKGALSYARVESEDSNYLYLFTNGDQVLRKVGSMIADTRFLSTGSNVYLCHGHDLYTLAGAQVPLPEELVLNTLTNVGNIFFSPENSGGLHLLLVTDNGATVKELVPPGTPTTCSSLICSDDGHDLYALVHLSNGSNVVYDAMNGQLVLSSCSDEATQGVRYYDLSGHKYLGLYNSASCGYDLYNAAGQDDLMLSSVGYPANHLTEDEDSGWALPLDDPSRENVVTTGDPEDLRASIQKEYWFSIDAPMADGELVRLYSPGSRTACGVARADGTVLFGPVFDYYVSADKLVGTKWLIHGYGLGDDPSPCPTSVYDSQTKALTPLEDSLYAYAAGRYAAIFKEEAYDIWDTVAGKLILKGSPKVGLDVSGAVNNSPLPCLDADFRLHVLLQSGADISGFASGFSPEGCYSNGLAPVSFVEDDRDLIGYLDSAGVLTVPPIYRYVGPARADGTAWVVTWDGEMMLIKISDTGSSS